MLYLMFFSKNNLLSSNQSRFRPSEYCVNQPLFINHENLSAFEMRLKSHWIFLGICKAFDTVWNNGFIFKLHQNDIYGKMVNSWHDVFSVRKQRVILNYHCSSFTGVDVDVPQNSLWDIVRSILFHTDTESPDLS